MRQRVGKDGYMRVTLQNKAGKKEVIATHLLVGRAFLTKPKVGGGGRVERQVVRHKDGKRKHPMLSNLEYGTEKQNSKDKRRHGTDARGERNASSLLSEEEAVEILELKGQMTQQEIADEFGISRQAVSDIHRGITWAYEED
jgi:predicted DNA binding protein